MPTDSQEAHESPYSHECPFCGYRWPIYATVTDSPGCPDCGGTQPVGLDPTYGNLPENTDDPSLDRADHVHTMVSEFLHRIAGRRAGIARAALIVWDEDEHRN